MIKKVLTLSGSIISILLIVVILISMFIFCCTTNSLDMIQCFGGYKLISVWSCSMEPLIRSGDLTISKAIKPEDIMIGDVITFGIYKGTLLTHRVVGISKEFGKIDFITKGDSNIESDVIRISAEQVKGKVIGDIPLGGELIRFIQSSRGFAVFIVFPIFLLVQGELKRVLSDVSSNSLDGEGSINAKS